MPGRVVIGGVEVARGRRRAGRLEQAPARQRVHRQGPEIVQGAGARAGAAKHQQAVTREIVDRGGSHVAVGSDLQMMLTKAQENIQALRPSEPGKDVARY